MATNTAWDRYMRKLLLEMGNTAGQERIHRTILSL